MIRNAITKLAEHNFTPTNVRVKYAIIDGDLPPDSLTALKRVAGVSNVVPDDKRGFQFLARTWNYTMNAMIQFKMLIESFRRKYGDETYLESIPIFIALKTLYPKDEELKILEESLDYAGKGGLKHIETIVNDNPERLNPVLDILRGGK